MVNPYSKITVNPYISTLSELNDLLIQIEKTQPFDDINIGGGRNIVVKSNGGVYRLFPELSPEAVESIANEVGGGSNVAGDIKAHRLLDASHQVTDESTSTVYRYRVAAAAFSTRREKQIQIVFRSIKTVIPSIEYTNISLEDYAFIVEGPGLVIVSGETGSGKTTTMASIIGQQIRDDSDKKRNKIIKTYEQPVEYIYEELIQEQVDKSGDCSVEVYQHEIGTDIDSFDDALKNALRSNPDIILLGEAREYETIVFALQMAISGHLVFITTHAKGAIQTINRLVSSFPESLQQTARSSFTAATKMVISQRLIPGINGRVPNRETLKITESDQRRFSKISPNELQKEFSEFFIEKGKTFYQHGKELHDAGQISDIELNMIELTEGVS